MITKEKAVVCRNGSIVNLLNGLSTSNHTSQQQKFQYYCSFCLRELPNNSVRFKGIGACPKCFKLSHLFVDSLRQHKREYALRFEVKK